MFFDPDQTCPICFPVGCCRLHVIRQVVKLTGIHKCGLISKYLDNHFVQISAKQTTLRASSTAPNTPISIFVALGDKAITLRYCRIKSVEFPIRFVVQSYANFGYLPS